MGFSFSKTEKMLYTLHLFLAHPVLLVLWLIVPSVEQLCIVISQKIKRLTRLTIWKRKRRWIRLNLISSNYYFNSSWSSLKNSGLLQVVKNTSSAIRNLILKTIFANETFFPNMRHFFPPCNISFKHETIFCNMSLY